MMAFRRSLLPIVCLEMCSSFLASRLHLFLQVARAAESEGWERVCNLSISTMVGERRQGRLTWGGRGWSLSFAAFLSESARI